MEEINMFDFLKKTKTKEVIKPTLDKKNIDFVYYGLLISDTKTEFTNDDGEYIKQVDGKEFYESVSKETVRGICLDWNLSGIKFLLTDDTIKNKINSMTMQLFENGTGTIETELNNYVTNEELNILTDFVYDQLINKWGRNPDFWNITKDTIGISFDKKY